MVLVKLADLIGPITPCTIVGKLADLMGPSVEVNTTGPRNAVPKFELGHKSGIFRVESAFFFVTS